MKPRLSPSVQQQLVLTPQLRLAIRLLQLSSVELEAEISEAVASNPLLDWTDAPGEDGPDADDLPEAVQTAPEPIPESALEPGPEPEFDPWQEYGSRATSAERSDDLGQPAAEDSLRDHLLLQLHLGHFSPLETSIGVALIESIDDDGYLRDDLDTLAASLRPELDVRPEQMLPVLHRIQCFDPVGAGARSVTECLQAQLRALADATPGRDLALLIVTGLLDRLPRLGLAELASQLDCSQEDAKVAVALVQSLDPRPGSRFGALPEGAYVRPDCVIWRHQGLWTVALAPDAQPRIGLQQDYQRLLGRTSGADAEYLRGHLQEARWLLKALESRSDTLLRVVRCLVREQAGFLEFGPQALHPLTLREVAAELELHESTVSRAVAGKFAHTPRGTLPLRAFFASGIETGAGGSTSSTAIQDMIRKLVANENPLRPLSDAKLADTLKKEGVPVARRTIAKYREALQIPASHERVRVASALAPAPRPPGSRPTAEGGP